MTAAVQDVGATLIDRIRACTMLSNIKYRKDTEEVRENVFKIFAQIDTVERVRGFINLNG